MNHRFGKLRISLLMFLALFALIIVACGSAAQPDAPPAAQQDAPAKADSPAAPAAPAAPKAAPLTPKESQEQARKADTVIVAATPVPGLYAADVPEWVSMGADNHYNDVIRFVHRANPGFLDVHYGASSTTVLLPSGVA